MRVPGGAVSESSAVVRWRDRLASERVLRVGRAWLESLLGPTFDGTVFLAGGVFKTLLNRQPPRDIDLWAPSLRDRRAVCEALDRRGAMLHRDDPPYRSAFRTCGLDGREVDVEVSYRRGASTLEALLAGFDIGVAAIGVARCGRRLVCAVDAVARETVARRAILVRRPLPRPKHALCTLERVSRYARELGYAVAPEALATVWDVYRAQTVGGRRRMRARRQRRFGTGHARRSHGDP